MKTNNFLYYALGTLVLNALQRKRIRYYYSSVLECNAVSVDSVVFDIYDISVLRVLYRYSSDEDVRAFCLDAIKFLKSK